MKDGLSFTVFAVGESPAWEKLYYLAGPKEAVKLTFNRNRRSASLPSTAASKPLVFGIERIDPATNRKTYVPVAEVLWPDSAVKVLCVFAATGGDTPQIRVVAVDDGIKAFPPRSVRVFNATGVPLLARIAGHEGGLPPGISPSYAYAVTSEDPNRIGSFPLAFAVVPADAPGAPRLLYSGYGEAWPQGRALVFVQPLPQVAEGGVQVKVLVDAPPPAPKPKPTA